MLGIERAAAKAFNGALSAFGREVTRERVELSLDGCGSLQVRLQTGELSVAGDAGTEAVEGELVVRCTRPWSSGACSELAAGVSWQVERLGDGLRLALRLPSGDVTGLHGHLRLRVPPRLAVRARVGMGSLKVRDLAGDVRLGLGMGELDLALARHGVGSLRLASSVGSAVLRLDGRRLRGRGLVRQVVRWRGDGAAEVRAGCGLGSVRAALV
jgi:hypothetical protein